MKHELTAKRLLRALSAVNKIPQELANESGVSKSSISQYLKGSHKPSNISSGKMAKVLDVDPLWLMGFDVPNGYILLPPKNIKKLKLPLDIGIYLWYIIYIKRRKTKMMTSKQKWFIGKLMKEIEEMGYSFNGNETYYGSAAYDSYQVTKQEASKDIDMLLSVKAAMENGSTFNDAYAKWTAKEF